MATNYPGALDSLTNPAAGDALTSPSHSAQHANANDAIEAIETELGTNPKGSAATVKARLDAIETGARLGANSVGATQLADSAVDTAAIQDGAVTAAKLARQPGNLLSENVAGGTDELAATTGFTGAFNCAVASTTAQAAQGSRSLSLTSSASGHMYVTTTAVAVTAGETYTATAAFRSAVSSRTCWAFIQWTNSSDAYISNSANGAVTSSTSAWSQATVSAVAPATAAYARVVIYVVSAGAASEVHYADKIGLWRGAGGKWQLPGVPIPGQSEIAVNDAVNLSGTGTPEGVVTAAPGSTWLQTDATTDVKGWIRWIKATGTGNTGWTVGPEADTGRRTVAASIDADWQTNTGGVGYLYLRRTGNRVTLAARLDRVTASGSRSTSDAVYTVPSGFVPSTDAYNIRGTAYGPAGVMGFVGDLSNPGQIDVWFPSGGTWAASDDVFFTATWTTTDAWPSSLPGSAA